mgnify:FL=1
MKPQSPGMLPIALMVDNAELDAQHDGLFSLIERLKAEAMAAGSLPPEVLHDLAKRFEDHFATEERLAREANIEFLVHGEEHAKNLRLLHKAVGEIGAGKLDLHTFLRYLEYWFEQHITGYDRRFAARLADAKIRH